MSLILHSGARHVSRDEVVRVTAPDATATWFPISHGAVIDRVETSVRQAGFVIRKVDYGLSRDDHRLFSVMDLQSPIVEGVSLAIGVRNSTDKSLPIGFCAGSRVMVCDNLAFRSEITISRKHTRFGEERYAEALHLAVGSLGQFQLAEAKRIDRLRDATVSDTLAESLILRAYEQKVVSHLVLPKILREWREPKLDAFQPRTAWSLFNAFTEALKGRAASNPQEHAHLTVRLSDLFEKTVSEGKGTMVSLPLPAEGQAV